MERSGQLIKHRLEKCYIENLDAIEVLERYLPLAVRNKLLTFVFLDPPYQLETRTTNAKLYKHDSTEELHINLLDCVRKYSDNPNILFCITHYPSELYDEKLKGFNERWFSHCLTFPKDRKDKKMVECVWTNF
jgi:site-specific DNA-adenine methylase